MASKARRWLGLVTACAVACGGDDPSAQVPAATPVAGPGGGEAAAPVQDTATAETGELLREVFSYRASARDPFQSLVSDRGSVRPFLEDLRLTSVTYDGRYPARSVATLRDTTVNEPYTVRVDDEIGRMRVTEIRATEVVFTIEDFGVPRQVVLALRRPGNPGRSQ